jgi:ketosteroid isomerase-like protein
MSQENVEIARRGMEQFNRQFTSTEELDLDFLAPDVVLDNSNAALDAAVYRGHDGIREFMSQVRGMWTLQRAEAEEFIAVGEDRVITAFRMVSVGRDNIEVVFRAASLATVGGGKITHMKAFQSKADALEAVGLSEQDAHADS